MEEIKDVKPTSNKNNASKSGTRKNSRSGRSNKVKREQPRKDSKGKRVNFDNTRESKFVKDVDGWNGKGRDNPHAVKGNKYNDEDFKQVGVGKENDVSWYNKVQSMYGPATNISFNPTTGYEVIPWNHAAVPALFADYWSPTLGMPDLDAVNQLKESLYSFVVHANSRNTSYDSNDLFLTFIAGSQVFSYLASLIRAYGCMLNFDPLNRNTPQVLITAMGFDYDDFKDNLPNMLFDINQMITASRQIWVPSDFTFATRWFWMNSNIYMDGSSAKSQWYMHVQDVYWMFNETGFETGTALIPVIPANGYDGETPLLFMHDIVSKYKLQAIGGTVAQNNPLLTWSDCKQFFNDLMTPLLNSTYRGVMMGDILKAYGADKLFIVSEISSGYKIVPQYSAEVLTQIENETILAPTPSSSWGLSVDLDKNRIQPTIFSNSTTYQSVIAPQEQIINFHQAEEPTADQIMVATRLKAQGNKTGIPGLAVSGYNAMDPGNDKFTTLALPASYGFPLVTGTEIITFACLFSLVYGSAGKNAFSGTEAGYIPVDGYNVFFIPFYQQQTWYTGTSAQGYQTTSPSKSSQIALTMWQAFDWSPWIYLISLNDTGGGR